MYMTDQGLDISDLCLIILIMNPPFTARFEGSSLFGSMVLVDKKSGTHLMHVILTHPC